MSEQLSVFYDGRTVGTLTLLESQQMQFEYSSEWSSNKSSFPISISLPLDASFDPTTSHRFFANLLPEGNVRLQICRMLGISSDNDFVLLKAIGGDCAGALTITAKAGGSEKQKDDTSRNRYQEVSEDQLASWSVGTPEAFSAITGRNEVRLSLAGAQDKLPVHVQDGRILVPIGNTPSTHLLKFASPFYSHLPENETFVTMLARAVGLPAVEIVLRKTKRASVALIARYDRVRENDHYRRLHQEDFCQALGISPASKYQNEGGPSLQQCADILRRHSTFPVVDLQRLLHWSLFNLIAGNADAHGKNISLLYENSRSIRLAPFYDLVCTRNYDNISRHSAMSIGGSTDPGQIRLSHLQTLATDLRINAKTVIDTANRLCDQISDALTETAQKFEFQFGPSPVLERIPLIIRKQIRRLRPALKRSH